MQPAAAQIGLHGREIAGLDEHDEAVGAAKFRDECGGGADDLRARLRAVGRRAEFLSAGSDESGGLFARGGLTLRLEEEFDEACERGIAEGAAQLDLLRVKARVVLADAALDGIVLGVVGLHEDLAAARAADAPPSAARRLRDEHEAAFRRAEVRHVETGVGADNADGGDTRDVMPFGDHLRAEQDIVFSRAEAAQDVLMREFRACRIAIHADDARLGDECAQLLLQFLRA